MKKQKTFFNVQKYCVKRVKDDNIVTIETWLEMKVSQRLDLLAQKKFQNGGSIIEIINNTRGGIGTGNISRRRERANGGQIQVPDALEERNTELCIRMHSAVFIV